MANKQTDSKEGTLGDRADKMTVDMVRLDQLIEEYQQYDGKSCVGAELLKFLLEFKRNDALGRAVQEHLTFMDYFKAEKKYEMLKQVVE